MSSLSGSGHFDQGYEDESKRIATSIRVLVHTTKHSHGLLDQLGELEKPFWSSVEPYVPGKPFITGYYSLIWLGLSDKGNRVVAPLDRSQDWRQIEFNDWWNEVVFVDMAQLQTTRKDLVMSVANQDGGAHVDPKLNDAYRKLSRENSLGIAFGDQDGFKPVMFPERVAMRQIAHEILRTLKLGYTKTNELPDGFYLVPNS